jgi:RimJ/RimL family protein N-acetyltransferase
VTQTWPLFDLAIRTPRLVVRLARESEFAELVDVIGAGIHDPATMPFSNSWTDVPAAQRNRESFQWWWRQRAEWQPDDWSFDGTVFLDGRIIGVQNINAKQFAAARTVHTGSWLGLAHQGQGYGKEMRAAILELAFTGLGADVAFSGAFFDNPASLGTSRSLGYRENGRDVVLRRGVPTEMINLRLDRQDWEAVDRPPCSIEGLDGCLDMFGLSGPSGAQAGGGPE